MREKMNRLLKEKITNIKNKDFLLFIVIIALMLLIPIFGELSGQNAKLKLSSIFLLIYLPIILISIHNNKKLTGSRNLILIFVSPILIEFLFNIINKNNNELAYIDLSVISIATIFSLYLLNFCQRIESPNKSLGILVILIAIITAFSSFLEMINNQQAGRFLMGNQNIAAYILLVSLPFVNYFKVNKLYKLLYLLSIIVIIGFLYKSRLATMVTIVYSFFYLKVLFNESDIKKFIATWFISVFIVILILIQYNDRFINLVNTDIFFRLMPWERLIYGIDLRDLLFGVGTGNYGLMIYKLQNTFSSIEIVFAKDTFIHAHNFLIDRFVSGGGVVFLGYIFIYLIIIKEFFKKTDKYNDQKYLFHAFFIGLTLSLFDIVHNHIAGFLIFQFITILLLAAIFDKKDNFKKYTCLIILVLTMPIIFMIFHFGKNLNHQVEYNKLVNLVNSKTITEEHLDGFISKFPHYGEVDTIKFYYKLFNNNMKFEESMENDYKIMNSYNKYSQKRLHFSTSYYAIKNYDEKLIDAYQDILYKNLISHRVIPPNYSPSKIKILVSRKTGKILFNTVKCCSLDIPDDMFSQMKYINSGISGLKIAEPSIDYVVSNAIFSVDTISRENDTRVLKHFFQNVNEFSQLLKF